MDEASQASMAALTLNPTRTSAWINLAMISAAQGKQKTAVSAYLLGYKYSQNPQKTEEFLAKQIQEDNEAIRLGASKALEIIEAGR
jgi:Flp pilus assembly protein TadD